MDSSEEKGKGAPRSPRYPSDGLETCIAWARKIYDAEKRSTTSAAVVVKHMGYASLSGASRVALSALKKFGLLVEDGSERVRISDDAVRLFLAPDEDTRLAILRKLAQTPEIVRDIIAEHPDGLPSDESLKYKLATERGFSEQAAHTFIKALKETVRVAKLGPGEYAPPEETPKAETEDPPVETTKRETPPVKKPPDRPAAGSTLHVELSDGTSVDVVATGALSAETFEELLDYLKVYERVLKKRQAAKAEDPS